MSGSPRPPSAVDWAEVARALGERFGLRVLPGWGQRLARGVRSLAAARDQPEEELVARAQVDALLQRELVSFLTVEETFFLRHPEQLALVSEHVSELLAARPAEGVSLWSAGCSSGEEAYSLVIALQARLGPAGLARVRVIGSDLDGQSIARARAGRYGRWSFRGVDMAALGSQFTVVGDQLELGPGLRAPVAFEHESLQSRLARAGEEPVDVVLFRNVAIYLEPATLREVYIGLARALRPGGILITGYADPAPAPELFRVARSNGVPHYVRPECAERTPCSAARAPTAVGGGSRGSRPDPTEQTSSGPLEHKGARDSSPSVPEARGVAVALERADRGELEAALGEVSAVLVKTPTQQAALFARGRIAFAAGLNEQAVNDLRAALLVLPGDALARYWYALALRATGRRSAATTQAMACSAGLARCTPDDILSDGRTSASELRLACDELSRRLA